VALSRVPERLRPLVDWVASRWAGRVVLATVAGFRRLEAFDRAMALGAQLFTSVVPILIMMSVWVGESASERFAEAIEMSSAAEEVLDQALDEPGGTAFGVLGSLFVLISATSLSRAITRAMATVWWLPRPKTRLSSSWRWLAVVIALALSVVAARALGRYTDPVPPRSVWTVVVTFLIDIVVTVFVPWLLLAGQVQVRRLVPGAVLFALVLVPMRLGGAIYLPRALEESADRYGTIGVAFTYLAWLYVVSLIYLGTAIVGQVIAEDRGRLGRFIRRGESTQFEQSRESGEVAETPDSIESAGPESAARPGEPPRT
jgi:membrane protein